MSEILDDKGALGQDFIDIAEESEIPIRFDDEPLQEDKKHRVLSLFSGCGLRF